MIGGQVVDVASCGVGLDEGMLNFIYELKTGALIEKFDDDRGTSCRCRGCRA